MQPFKIILNILWKILEWFNLLPQLIIVTFTSLKVGCIMLFWKLQGKPPPTLIGAGGSVCNSYSIICLQWPLFTTPTSAHSCLIYLSKMITSQQWLWVVLMVVTSDYDLSKWFYHVDRIRKINIYSRSTITGSVPHVYYMCDTYVIHV